MFLLFSAGCASYTAQTQGLRATWAAGNYAGAAQIADSGAHRSSSTDAVLWDLEAGATARASGNIAGSITAFHAADALFEYWDTQPEISISRESESLLVNPTVLPYRGYDYDRIMESIYQALNYWQVGKFDEARVELNRALDRQQTAMKNNEARVAKAQQAAAQSGANGGYDAARAQSDSHFQSQFQQTYSPLNGLKYYANYVNPVATYLRAIGLLSRPLSATDYESARVDFTRVQAMIGHNAYIDADCDLAAQLANNNGAKMPPVTFVIYETGQAPDRLEARLDIPLFVVSRNVPYVGVAFPVLAFNRQFSPGLVVQAIGGAALQTAVLCDMDSVIAQEFRNDLPDVVVKTLVSAGAKAAAAYGLHQATQKNDLLGALTTISSVIYEDVTNRADLRTWVTLPKQFQFCRVSSPADHKLYLARSGYNERVEIDLPDSPVTMIYVKSTLPYSPLAVQVFTLR